MRAILIRNLRVHRLVVLALIDSVAWIAALFLAVGLRLSTWSGQPVLLLRESQGSVPLYGVLAIGVAAGILHVALAWTLKLHHGRSALGSFEELFGLASVVMVVGLVVGLANALSPQLYVPRTSTIIGACIALILCAWPRGLWRAIVTQARPNRFGVVSTPVIIVGAGAAGRELVGSMQRDPRQNWDPVAFVDDSPRMKHFRFRGVPVLGTTRELARVATKTSSETVVIAMPSVRTKVISRIYQIARDAELRVKVLPGLHDLFDGVSHTDIRDVEPSDFLGRNQVNIDVESIADHLEGRRVLVTGAGGSIGSELCRQIARFAPERLVMLDRDESALHAVQLSIYGRADLESPDAVLADIRDAGRIREVFESIHPDVVFHAAALKHVNMLERHPAEAVKTNVLGTLNVLEASAESGVMRFVNISTDKAADPKNVLGMSKRIAEGLTADFSTRATGTYLSVRFGNVLGTRGSVLTTFTTQIENGGPVTVTDAEVSRFFMTVTEAVQLVVQAAAIGRDGEALVLDMGEPVRILDVARQMIEQSGQRIDVIITGLKPGEKLHETLFGLDEVDDRPIHPLVSHVPVPRTNIPARQLLDDPRDDDVAQALHQMCLAMTSEGSDGRWVALQQDEIATSRDR